MKSFVMRLSLVVAASLSLPVATPASAADTAPPAVKTPPAPALWTFEATPYLWAAGITGTVGPGAPVPPVNVDVGFDDVLRHLKMAFMGTFEARYNNQIGLMADIAYLSVKVGATGPAGFVDAELTDKTFFGTFAGAYRVLDSGPVWVDVLAGARVWSLSTSVTVTAPGPVTISSSTSKAWADAIVGLRAQADLTREIFAQVYADAGAGGAQSDWQVAGYLGYRFSRSTTLFAGYRYLSIDYRRSGYVFDVDLSGPVLGVTFKF